MNKLTINRQNGNLPKTLAGQDHVSGLLFYVPTADVPEAFKTEPIQPVSTLERAELLGITAESSAKWSIRVLHYTLSEIFRLNQGVSLYLCIVAKPATLTFDEIKSLSRYSSGAIRQVGVWMGDTELTSALVTKLQTVADALDAENAPLSVLVQPKVKSLASLTDLSGQAPRVSVIIGQDGTDTAADLYADTANQKDNAAVASVGALGTVLSLVSRASVHQSIGWVREFPTGINLPAFADGTLLRDADTALLEALDAKRLLFFVTYPGIAGSYVNDSHTLDAATSDYAMIESVRTMDKAVRGIRTYVTPELGSNVYIDAETGKLQPYTVNHLELTANTALEAMEKAGELSGYRVEIDPDQDVLTNSTIEMLIKQVPVGVVRKINVKIGFYKTV